MLVRMKKKLPSHSDMKRRKGGKYGGYFLERNREICMSLPGNYVVAPFLYHSHYNVRDILYNNITAIKKGKLDYIFFPGSTQIISLYTQYPFLFTWIPIKEMRTVNYKDNNNNNNLFLQSSQFLSS